MLALTLATATSAAAAATLVVSSSGPSSRAYPAGKAIADSARINLRQNDVVVILDGRGTRTLRGPGTFSPTAASPSGDSRNDPSVFASRTNDPRRRIGAVRSIESAPRRNPNIWFVDTGVSSTMCIPSDTPVTLWRAGDQSMAVATLTSVADGRTETLQWNRGVSQMTWPSTLPVVEGTEYRVNFAGDRDSATIKFALLRPNPTGIEDMTQMLIQHGCEAQIKMLIDIVAVPDGTQPPG